jgi:hypothetical protein
VAARNRGMIQDDLARYSLTTDGQAMDKRHTLRLGRSAGTRSCPYCMAASLGYFERPCHAQLISVSRSSITRQRAMAFLQCI